MEDVYGTHKCVAAQRLRNTALKVSLDRKFFVKVKIYLFKNVPLYLIHLENLHGKKIEQQAFLLTEMTAVVYTIRISPARKTLLYFIVLCIDIYAFISYWILCF